MYSALGPTSQALFAKLQDPALLAVLTGGWFDDVPATFTFPFGWYELNEEDAGGIGPGAFPLVTIRTHIYSQYGGMTQAQEANRLTIKQLRDQTLAVDQYNAAGLIFWDDTILLPDEELNGMKVHELVSTFRIYLDEVDTGEVPSVQTGWIDQGPWIEG